MADERLVRGLVQFGLSEQEALIYLAGLRLGPTTVQKLARAAGIKRTTGYSLLEGLQAKGLFTIEHHGFKRSFVAESPENLQRMFEARELHFKELLPAFSALHRLKEGESTISLFNGIERIKEVYESLLRDVRADEDYMIVSSMQNWYDLAPEFFEDFTWRRAELSKKLRFRIRLLLQDSPIARRHKKIERELNETIRFLPKKTVLTTNLVIIPKKVVIHQLVPPINAMIIENPNVVRMHREMFEIMWTSLEEPQSKK